MLAGHPVHPDHLDQMDHQDHISFLRFHNEIDDKIPKFKVVARNRIVYLV